MQSLDEMEKKKKELRGINMVNVTGLISIMLVGIFERSVEICSYCEILSMERLLRTNEVDWTL